MAVPSAIPPLNLAMSASAEARASAGGYSTFGDINKGINTLVFMGSLILVSAIVWKLNK